MKVNTLMSDDTAGRSRVKLNLFFVSIHVLQVGTGEVQVRTLYVGSKPRSGEVESKLRNFPFHFGVSPGAHSDRTGEAGPEKHDTGSGIQGPRS